MTLVGTRDWFIEQMLETKRMCQDCLIEMRQLVYMMQKILLGIKGDLKDVFLQFQSKMHNMVNTCQTTCSAKTKFPRTGKDARRFFTDGSHSILKNFPVQEVFEVVTMHV